MARNIEFQGKSITTGEWVTGNLSFANNTRNYNELQYHDTAYIEQIDALGRVVKHPVIPQTNGQYTNVIGQDKNKIFEHDIISNGKIEGEVYWDYCYNGWRIAVVNEKNNLHGIDFDNTYKVIDHKYDRLIQNKKLRI